jgi:hypothetical protein
MSATISSFSLIDEEGERNEEEKKKEPREREKKKKASAHPCGVRKCNCVRSKKKGGRGGRIGIVMSEEKGKKQTEKDKNKK